TPVADIPPDYLQQFAEQLGERAEGMDQQQISDLLRREVQNIARQIAERHEDVINDQLEEGGWMEALESFIDDFVTYPAAFMRGPLLQKVPEFAWQEGWQMVEMEEIK